MTTGWCMWAAVKIYLVLCYFVFRGDTIFRENKEFHTMGAPGNKTLIYFSYLAASESEEYQREKQARLISGALSYAVSKINNDSNLLPNHTLAFKWSDTLSDELEVLRLMCHSWTKKVYAFFGPETYCGVAARLAAAWNIPMISYKCANHEVSNKTIYPTFARTFPPANQVTKFIVSLLKHHNWRQYSLVVGSSNRMMDIKSKLVQLSFEYNLTITNITTYKEPYIPIVGNSEIPGIVNNTYPHTRIYVFLGDQNGIVDFLCNLYDMGVLDGGKYIVIYIDHMPYNPKGSLKYFKKAMDNPTDNLNCGAAARSLLVMAPQPPANSNYTHFEEMVNKYNKLPPFDFPDPFAAGKKVPLFAAHLYDAVYLYAECIHNMLLENLNIRNGTDIINRLRNKRFQSIQGFQCHIDDNGDALGNYSLLAWREDKSANREANFTMDPVGSFIIDPNISLPIFQLNKGSEIAWMNGKPPQDEPDCGFYNEECMEPKDDTAVITLSVLGGVCVLTIVIFIILYKKWRYEQAIAGLLWKICSSDLHIDSDKPECKSESKYSLSSRLSLDSRTTMTQVYARTGNYKGQIVALKMYEKKNFVLTHKMKREMKMMRDIRHGNVNAFIGACVDPPHFIIVTEYCSKGSLQDVLENEDMKLDDMFIASLVKDLIQGMIVIHESELGYHGNLKSSNCVISSRWTLQVTDYGILQIRAATYRREDEHAYFRNLQWTSPEILRNPEKKGSPKGDVYSFGIVLYEILGRCSPYRDLNITPKEIIERIEKNHEPIRPNVDVLNCDPYLIECMKICWHECPEIRPDFRSVWRMLKPMRQGTKRNIFDNMMAIMERYQCNLEDLVSERTEQLIEEKKKTEMLLHRMLPKSVAETLKKGLPVKPESYQSVTIYFSDICGFTALSAESTPMEVVDLLNDLYTLFDSIIHHYDVYKVETIGDAYMVVSGIPIRNGDNHAGEIASMSLQLLNAIHTFKIRHKPKEVIKLRIGIHSGQCVAGVVGLIMPRYCLFGDTVNTASRMESNGEALKIHCSETTKSLLDKLCGYVLHERGLVNMKGKGELRTFWLISEDKEVRQQRLAVLRHNRGTRSIYSLQHPRTNSWKRNAFNRRSRETDSANFDLINTTATANSMVELKQDGSFFEIIRKPDCETNSNLVSSAINLVSASSPNTVTGKTASMSDFHSRLDASGCVGAGGERIGGGGGGDAGGIVCGNSNGGGGDGGGGSGDGGGGGVDGGASNSGTPVTNSDASKSNVSLHYDLNSTKTQNNPTIMCRACSVKERRSNAREFFVKSHPRTTNLNPEVRRGNTVNLESSLNDNNDVDSASERDCLLTNQIASKPVESIANVTQQDTEPASMEGQTEKYVEFVRPNPNAKQHLNQHQQQQQHQQQLQSSQTLSPQQHQQQHQNQNPP